MVLTMSKPGDMILVAYGLSVPVIVRRVEDEDTGQYRGSSRPSLRLPCSMTLLYSKCTLPHPSLIIRAHVACMFQHPNHN
jgi:hypothetical protein